MSYRIEIDCPALKFLMKQPQEQRERIMNAIRGLPDAGDIKPMSGHKNQFRLRVGSYRVIYTVEHSVLTVRVLEVGNRGDVYK